MAAVASLPSSQQLSSSPSAMATQFPGQRRGILEAPSGSKYSDFLRTWTDSHVQQWLQEIRCGHLAPTFKQNDIRSDVLLELEQATLKEMGITSIGDRLRILNGVKALRARCNTRSHQARTSILLETTPSPAPVAPPQRSPSTSRRPAPLQLATRPLPNHPGPNSAATTPLSGHPNRNNRLPPPPMPPPSTGSRTPINAPDYTNQPLPPAPNNSLLTPVSAQPASWAPGYGLPPDPRAGKPPRSTSPLPNPPPRGASFSPGFAPSRSPALQAAAHGRNLSASSVVPPNPPPKTSNRPSTAGSHPYALHPPGANALSPINEGFNSTLPSPGGFAVGRGPFPQGQQSQSQLQQQQSTRPGTPSAPSTAPSQSGDLRRQLVKFHFPDEGRSTTINVEDCSGGVEVVERALRKFGKLAPGNRVAERAGTDDGGLSVDGWSVYLDWGDEQRPGTRRQPLSEAQLLSICHSRADDPARERGLTLRRSAKSVARAKALAALSPSSADPTTTPPLSPLQTTMNPDLLLPDNDLPARPKNYRRASTISVLSGLGVPFPEKATDAMENDRPLSPSSPASAAWTKQGRRASAAAAKVRNFFGQRPPSELIGAHLREFFPGADRRVLKRTSIMRASGVPGQRRDSAGAGRRDSTWSFHPAQGGSGPGSRFSVSTVGSGSRASKRVSMASMAPSVRPRAGMELPPDEAASAAGTPRVSVSTDDATLVDDDDDSSRPPSSITPNTAGLLPPVEFPRESLSDSLSATLAAPNPSRASRRLSHVTELKSRVKDTSDAASMMTVDMITEAVETRRSVRKGEADTASMIEGWTHVGGEEAVEEAAEAAPVTPDDVPTEMEEEDVDVDMEEEYDEEEYDEETEEEDEDEEELDEDDDEDDDDEEDGTGRAETSGDIKWIKGALIGSGSFGKVYLGMDATNGLLMAVKQVELAGNMDGERRRGMVEALEREIELLKDLQHEHIVQYLYSSADDAHFNIFLEYVPGGSVAALLRNYGAFEEPLVRNFVRQILQGLDYVHERGIVHRDLKGANVLVDNKGGIKISDFGVSKKLEDNLMPGNRMHRPSLQGSVFWMAPEVVKQTAYTKKADIWSVGCLVVEMFTGDHPWPLLNQMQAIFKVGAGNTAPPIPRDISMDAQGFLERCFELDHNARPSAGELLQHAWLAKKGGKAARRDALAVAAATASMQ